MEIIDTETGRVLVHYEKGSNILYHNAEGPAKIWLDDEYQGTEHWYYHGRLHRIDGPAVTIVKNLQIVQIQWWINHNILTFKEWKEHVSMTEEEITYLLLCYGELINKGYKINI